MSDTFTIEEIVSSGDGLRVVLAGTDAPYGRPRDMAALESGGPVEHEEIYFPGRKKPIYQIKQARQRPLVIKGAFRDHLAVSFDGVEVGTQHARSMRDQLEAIRERCNPLRLTWASDDGDGQERQGILSESSFGEETSSQITYELTFKIAIGVAGNTSNGNSKAPTRQDTSDTSSQSENLASTQMQKASLLSLNFPVSQPVVQSLISSISTTQSALGNSTVAALSFERAPSASRASAAQKLLGAAKSAVLSVLDTLRFYQETTVDMMVPTGDPVAQIAWWNVQYGGLDDWLAILNQMRNVAAEARKQIYRTERLYLIRQGDTLESIARQTLGDASRAGQLGVRQDQLIPGLLLRIPQAQ